MNNVFNIFFFLLCLHYEIGPQYVWWRDGAACLCWVIGAYKAPATKQQLTKRKICSLFLHWISFLCPRRFVPFVFIGRVHFLILVLFSSPTPKQCIVYFIQIVFLVNEQKYLYDWRWYHILKVSFRHHWAPIHVLLNINLSGGGGFVCRQTIKSSFKLSAHPTCWRDGWTKCQ